MFPLTPNVQDSKQSPADPLHGLRVHCWVLVLSGSCSVQENFFIDPLTGKSHSTDDVTFLGIESVWNHRNYYVNMQDCRDGCRVRGRHTGQLLFYVQLHLLNGDEATSDQYNQSTDEDDHCNPEMNILRSDNPLSPSVCVGYGL